MPKFQHNYLVFDEFGVKEILCMACGVPIKSRSEIKSQLDQNRIIRELSKHADYREIPVIIADNKIAFIMVCDNCKFVEIGDKEAKQISNQLIDAFCDQLKYEGKLPEVIEVITKERNFNVLRKADIMEVTKAFRGV